MNDKLPSSDLQAFADSARDLLRRYGNHQRVRTLREAEYGFERDAWKAIAAAGWPAVLVAEADGGLGLHAEEAAAIAREVGYALLPEPVIGAAMLTPCVLAPLSPSARRTTLITDLLSGDCVVGLAWQEREGQLDATAPEATLRREGGRLVLQGLKQWVVPGPGADGWLVTAQLADEGLALLWVPASSQGVNCAALPRIDGSPMGRVMFDDVILPAGALLGVGDAVEQAITDGLETARLLQSAELLGVAQRAFADTLEYLKTRVQFGKPIGANQALQHRMVDAYLQLELAEAGLHDLLAFVGGEPTMLAGAASRCKSRCSEAALHVTRLAIQFHGAMGYTDECAIGLYAKRAMQLSSWLGNARVHRARYRSLHKEPRHVDVDSQTKITRLDFPRDADWAAMDDASFRALIRGFFCAHYPPQLRYLPRRLHWPEIRDWYMTLSRQGWIAPSWPREYGGMALPPDKLLALIEEQEAHGVARMPDQGLINLGPLLIGFGTEAQKRKWLPPILSGEHVWCQGYSEPNAGSDLASLRTEAVEAGEHFIVNGQKIWTTLALDATHIFMLVRTGKFEKKQEGISFLLADLSSPGVTVRSIHNIAGENEFCEVFFDKVRVPKDNLVGELHQGWQLAKALLGHERIFVGSPKAPQYALGRLQMLGHAMGMMDEPAFAERYVQLELDLADLRSLYARFANMVKRGEKLPPSVSLLKIWATETYSRIGVALMENGAEHGGALGLTSIGGEQMATLAPLMNSMMTTIYGGTNEVQRNIIARQVLGLPG